MSLADVTSNLRAPVASKVGEAPAVRVHAVEWRKVQAGEPVEINPSVGHGYKIMTVDEWAARWKRNDAFPECLQCGGKSTKEHHFTQVRLGMEPAGAWARRLALTGACGGAGHHTGSAGSSQPAGLVGRRLAAVGCCCKEPLTPPHCSPCTPPPPPLSVPIPPCTDLVPREEEVGERDPVPGLPHVQLPLLLRPRLQDSELTLSGSCPTPAA